MDLEFLLAVTKFGKETRLAWFDWNWLVAFGLLGTSIFSARFIVQWRASEKAGESVIPISFWYLSIAGSLITGFYFLAQRDPVGVLGYLPNSWIYIRNLILIKRKQRRDRALTAAIPDDSSQQKDAVVPVPEPEDEPLIAQGLPVPPRSIPAEKHGFFWSLLRPWPLAIIFFLATLTLTTRDNSYPFYYEKDAHSKVKQVLTGERNFYHPLMMLNGTDAIMRFIGLPRTEHTVVVTGRWFMAFCTATAVAAFSLLAYRLRGPLTAVSVGVLVMTHNLVFELAHFFKEDPTLLMGLALSFLAMQLFWEKPTIGRAAWLGVACALAVSGKYVGIAAFILAVALLVLAKKKGGCTFGHWMALIIAFLIVCSGINYQILTRTETFKKGFEVEMKDVTRESKRQHTPHLGQLSDVMDKLMHPWILVLAAIQIAITIRRKQRNPVEWMLFLYPVLFTVVLVYSPRLFTRHFLPVLSFLCVLAGFAIPVVVYWVWPRLGKLGLWLSEKYRFRGHFFRHWPQWVAFPMTLITIAVVFREAQRPMFWKRYKAFANPTRERLIDYVNTNLPADAVIAADFNTFLVDNKGKPREDFPVKNKVIVYKRLAYAETLDELYKQGVTHVALHSRTSPLLFSKIEQMMAEGGEPTKEALEAAEEDEEERKGRNYTNNREFYEDLKRNSEQLHFVPNGRIAYVSPAVKIIRLNPRAAEAEKVSAEISTTEPTSTN